MTSSVAGLRARAASWLGARFQRRVAVALAGVSLAFSLGVFGASYLAIRREMLRDARARTAGIAEDVALRVGEPLVDIVRHAFSLSENPLLTNALVDSEGLERYVEPFLTHVTSSSLMTTRLELCSFDGSILAASGGANGTSYRNAPWLPTVIEAGHPFSDVVTGSRGRSVLVAIPIRYPATNAVEGALVATIEVRGADLRITDRQVRLLSGTTVLAEAGERTGPLLVSVVPVQVPPVLRGLALMVEVGIPQAEIMGPLHFVAAAFAVGAVLLSIAVLLAARLIARRLTRPVVNLSAAAERIATRGEIGQTVEVQGGDEVAELGHAINSMLGRLQATTADKLSAEAALRAQVESALNVANRVLDLGEEPIEVLGADGRIVYANRAAARLHGVEADGATGRALWEGVPGRVEQVWRAAIEETLRTGRALVDAPATIEGRSVPLETHLGATLVDGSRYIVAWSRDISDRRLAERATRLAGLGNLATGIAHELNSPLAVVQANLAFIAESRRGRGAEVLPGEGEIADACADALSAARRMGEIIRSIREVSVLATEDRHPVVLLEEAQLAVQALRRSIEDRARLVIDVDPRLQVTARAHELAEALHALLANASDAIAPGAAEANQIAISARALDDGEVLVAVRDTGGGISPEHLDHVMEPFFTTKRPGRGVGNGLWIVYAIVTAMRGRVQISSELGKGTEIVLALPGRLAPAPAETTGV